MFLRRLTRYVSEQNWLAVLIEFVLVVLGVYLGLVLGNWNEDRQDKELYDQAFGRVITEIESNLGGVEYDQESLRERTPIVQKAIEELRACRTGPEAEANLQAAFAPMDWEIEFILDTHALEQLIANENFLPFQDEMTRTLLMDLLSHMQHAQRYSIEINDELNLDPLSAWSATAPGELSYASPTELLDAYKAGNLDGTSVWRETQLSVPMEEACTNKTLLTEFYLWEMSAYAHTLAAHDLVEHMRIGLEMLGHPQPEPEDADIPSAEEKAKALSSETPVP